MTDTSMLSFYRNNLVAPVRQNINDLNEHFIRRRVLYQQLGVGAGSFTDRRVLEVGPGTGQNALFVAAQHPNQLVLIEPNSTGVEAIKACFMPYPEWSNFTSIQNISIESYRDADQFDFVLCEGLIGASGHHDPTALMLSIANQVRIEGTLVLTCIEYVAYLSEMLRRLLSIEVTGQIQEISQKTEILLAIFSPHLQSLPSMSRRFDDWIIDNLINPASIGKLVSFEDCLNDLGDTFEILSTSPRFITDWTWYKKAALEPDFFNKVALDCYWCTLHNFMDYRSYSGPRPKSANRSLSSRCEEIHHQIRDYEAAGKPLVRQQIVLNLKKLVQEISGDLPAVAEALSEFEGWLSGSSVDPKTVACSEKFGTWFGRAATYLRFIRRR